MTTYKGVFLALALAGTSAGAAHASCTTPGQAGCETGTGGSTLESAALAEAEAAATATANGHGGQGGQGGTGHGGQGGSATGGSLEYNEARERAVRTNVIIGGAGAPDLDVARTNSRVSAAAMAFCAVQLDAETGRPNEYYSYSSSRSGSLAGLVSLGGGKSYTRESASLYSAATDADNGEVIRDDDGNVVVEFDREGPVAQCLDYAVGLDAQLVTAANQPFATAQVEIAEIQAADNARERLALTGSATSCPADTVAATGMSFADAQTACGGQVVGTVTQTYGAPYIEAPIGEPDVLFGAAATRTQFTVVTCPAKASGGRELANAGEKVQVPSNLYSEGASRTDIVEAAVTAGLCEPAIEEQGGLDPK